MKSIAKLLFILLATTFVSCSSDEPVKDNNGTLLGDPVKPFEFDYSGIDFRIDGYGQNPELKKYYGEIPAEGATFSISHEYNYYLTSKNNNYSMLKLFLNGEYVKGNQVEHYIPYDGIEYFCDWGTVETLFEGHKTVTTFMLEKNETGTPRDFHIYLSFIPFTADIYLTQESL